MQFGFIVEQLKVFHYFITVKILFLSHIHLTVKAIAIVFFLHDKLGYNNKNYIIAIKVWKKEQRNFERNIF